MVNRTRIFISYARPTADRARAIERALGPDYEVWIDDRLLAHRSFTDAIEEALAEAQAVVVVWSADAVRSDWVRAEASRAREMGKLVQLRVDAALLPLPYDQIHCIDLSGWTGDTAAPAWRSLLASIAAAALRSCSSSAPSVAPASRGPRAAPERRQVTALVCRPAASAGMEPEDLMAAVEACRAACERLVPEHGGTVMTVQEQGVLAYFGYPQAGEDEEAQAVRAALALSRCEPPFALGVATGLVVAGGADSGPPTVVGETPHLASKLAHMVAPGTVAVDAATRRLTAEVIDYRALDAPAAPAGAPAAETYEALRVAEIDAWRGLPGREGLVGREAELATLRQAWDDAGRGAGQIALVEGDAGFGKSALLAAFRAELGETPASIWRCAASAAARPLQPVIDWIEREARMAPGDDAATRRDKVETLAAQWGLAGQETELLAELLGLGSGGLDPERGRTLTLDLLVDLVERSADPAPGLVIVEDLQWADPTTLDLLDRIVRRTPERRQMILATARSEFWCGWFEHADVARVRLGALTAADARRLCAAVDREGKLSSSLVERILARADGVPLYVEEITRSVIEGAADGQAQVPSSLQGSLTARLDRLGPAKAVARVGAAIGRSFEYATIEAVADLPAADLRQALRDLVRAGLLDCAGAPPSSRYVFRQGLICDAAYDMLPRRQREALHRRIAEVLTRNSPEDPALIADHFARAGDPAAAVPFWAAAAQQAAAKAAHAEAVQNLERALAALRAGPRAPEDVGLELQLLIGLAVSAAATRGYTAREVGKALMEARAICDALGDVADLFPVLRGICAFMIMAGDMNAAEQLARRCRDIGLATGRPEHRIEGECPLGYVLWCKGELEAARAHLEAAADLYRRHDGARLPAVTPQDPLVQSLGPLQVLCHAMGDVAAAERASAELVAHAATLGVSISHAFGLFWRGFHAQVSGDFTTALEFASAAAAQCREYGYSALGPQAEITRVFAAGSLGDARAALTEAALILSDMERRGEVHAMAFKLGEIAALQAAAGDPEAAQESLSAAVEAAERSGERFWLPRLEARQAELRRAATPA